jgi:hypothetical protein
VRRGSVAAGAGIDCAPSAPSGVGARPLNFTVRLQVKYEQRHEAESPDRRISWSIALLAGFLSCLIFGLLASSRLLAITSALGIFLIALISGVGVALVVNLLRPPYETCPQHWRAFYDFLLRQLPSPD